MLLSTALLGATISSPQDQGCPFYFERQFKPALPAFQIFHQIPSGSFPLQTLSTDISSVGLTCSYPLPDPIPVSKSCPKLHPLLKHSLCLSAGQIRTFPFHFLKSILFQRKCSSGLLWACPPFQHLCLGTAQWILLGQMTRSHCFLCGCSGCPVAWAFLPPTPFYTVPRTIHALKSKTNSYGSSSIQCRWGQCLIKQSKLRVC